jgi:NAD(P)-dependent dehydrogenase (short-subunit alcohol dehydrogenase family)
MLHAPKNLLITGASSGIGEALARYYAAPGVHLAFTGRDRARLAAVAEACRAQGAGVETAAIDVADRQGLRAWIERIDRAGLLRLQGGSDVAGRVVAPAARARRHSRLSDALVRRVAARD